jgi:hypothetical protein
VQPDVAPTCTHPTADEDEQSSISALQSFMDDMVSYPFPTDSVLKSFSSVANQTTSQPDLSFLGGVSNSQLGGGSHSSDELNRSSVASKRNEKGAVPLPIIDDSVDDENVFLTGFHLHDKFSIHMEEQDPHEEALSRREEEENDEQEGRGRGREENREHDQGAQDRAEDPKEMRKIYRKYPPPMAGHLLGDCDALIDNILSKFNDCHPPRPDMKAVPPKHCDLYRDPLPSAVDDEHKGTQESPFPLTAKPVMLDENVVTYRQRTAPTRTFIAPDPTKRVPPKDNLENYTRRQRGDKTRKPPPPPPLTYAVLEPQSQEGTVTVPNPRRATRGPEESTYKTLSAKRPPGSTAQSFKSPRSGKAIKATSHTNVFISNEVDENSTLSKMMEMSNQLLQSKAKMLRHLNSGGGVSVSDSIHNSPDCTKIELKLAL